MTFAESMTIVLEKCIGGTVVGPRKVVCSEGVFDPPVDLVDVVDVNFLSHSSAKHCSCG